MLMALQPSPANHQPLRITRTKSTTSEPIASASPTDHVMRRTQSDPWFRGTKSTLSDLALERKFSAPAFKSPRSNGNGRLRRPLTRPPRLHATSEPLAAQPEALPIFRRTKSAELFLLKRVGSQLVDRSGERVHIRLAVPEDLDAVHDHIADHTGTGAGKVPGSKSAGDAYLLQEFRGHVNSPNNTVLFAEDQESKIGLGIITIAWVSARESYWQSLRVSVAARGRGVARLLFKHAAELAIARQGPGSVSSWGVVSQNKIMVDWSRRLNLHGPQPFRRYSALASEIETELWKEAKDNGFTFRSVKEEDVDAVMRAIPSFAISKSEFGTQNFLSVGGGWGVFSESEMRRAIAGESPDSDNQCALEGCYVLTGVDGQVAGLACLNKATFGNITLLYHTYTDAATPEDFRILLHALPSLAHKEGCRMAAGYTPVAEFMDAVWRKSPIYQRMTDTEQLEFHWRNVDHAGVRTTYFNQIQHAGCGREWFAGEVLPMRPSTSL